MQRNINWSSTHFHLSRRRVSGSNVMMSMYQYNQNKINGLGTAPEFEKAMDFYVHIDAVFVEPKECSNNKIKENENDLLTGSTEQQKLIEEHRENIELLTLFYQEQIRLDYKQWEQRFEELVSNMAAYEQELYEKDMLIDQLQKELKTGNKNYPEQSHREAYEQ